MNIQNRSIATGTAEIRLSDSGGDGFPLLMIHGSGASRQVFRRQFASELAREYRLIAVDLPGHGDSTDAADPAHDYAVPALAGTVIEVIEALGLQRFAVFGWSLGGHVGIEVLARHAGVAGLMLTGTPPVGRGPLAMLRGFRTNLDLLLASKESFSERDTQRFCELCYHGAGDPDFLAAIRRADGRVRPAVSRSLLRGEGVDQKLAVERADVPIAFVNGAEESVARLSYLSSLNCKHLWRGTCHIIANAGHAPFWDQPAVFNALLAGFATDAKVFRAAEPLRRRA